jgi:hypothetical protein
VNQAQVGRLAAAFALSSSRIMVAAYTASGGAFQPEKPRAWSPVSLTFPQSSGAPFDVSPDVKRLAVLLKTPEAQTVAKDDHITFFSISRTNSAASPRWGRGKHTLL